MKINKLTYYILLTILLWLILFVILYASLSFTNLANLVPGFHPAFEEVGSNSASGDGISGPGFSALLSLAIDPTTNEPHLAWASFFDDEQGNSMAEVVIKHWDGHHWINVMQAETMKQWQATEGPIITSPSIAFDENGSLYLAYTSSNASDIRRIRVKQLQAGTWHDIGDFVYEEKEEDALSDISLTIGVDQYPYISWQMGSKLPSAAGYAVVGNAIYVQRWNGKAWVDVGTNLAMRQGINRSTKASEHQMVIDSHNRIYLAWTDESYGPQNVYIMRWDGTEWTEVGPHSASKGGLGTGRDITLALNQDDMPYIAWMEPGNPYRDTPTKIHVRRWDKKQATWQDLDFGPSLLGRLGHEGASSPYLDIAPDNTVYLAWLNDISASRSNGIFIQQWTDSGWQEIVPGSASFEGIVKPSIKNHSPMIAVNNNGKLYLVWQYSSSSIYALQF